MKVSDSKRYLITNYHVIDLDSLNEKIEIEIWNKKKFILNPNNFNIKYLKKPKDIMSLEIKDLYDDFLDVEFLNYDRNYEDGYLIYKDADIFTIEHPLGKNASCSSGKIIDINEYEFDHNISTEPGSSGCPILLLNDNINLIKVIGIHKNGDEKMKINGGTFIGEIINEIKKEAEETEETVKKVKEYKNFIIAEIYIEDNDVNKKFRIINSYEEYMRTEKPYDNLDKDRMNEKEIKECIILINDKLIPFNYYYQFKEKGKHIIKYCFKNYLTKVNDIFNKCEDLIKIDLSSFKIDDKSNIALMFNRFNKLNEIKGVNKFISNNVEINKSKTFHIINNTIPIIDTKTSPLFFGTRNPRYLNLFERYFNEDGFQLFNIKNDTLVGVLEGPPNTPHENGYFLFKMIFLEKYPFKPPKFIFITNIFHPNISETGYVSVDILQDNWSPWLGNFDRIIYSIQSLLDDPNPYDFLNEKSAKLYNNDRKSYDETVKSYTFLFANHSKFTEDIKNMDIKVNINKEKKFKFLKEEDY